MFLLLSRDLSKPISHGLAPNVANHAANWRGIHSRPLKKVWGCDLNTDNGSIDIHNNYAGHFFRSSPFTQSFSQKKGNHTPSRLWFKLRCIRVLFASHQQYTSTEAELVQMQGYGCRETAVVPDLSLSAPRLTKWFIHFWLMYNVKLQCNTPQAQRHLKGFEGWSTSPQSVHRQRNFRHRNRWRKCMKKHWHLQAKYCIFQALQQGAKTATTAERASGGKTDTKAVINVLHTLCIDYWKDL